MERLGFGNLDTNSEQSEVCLQKIWMRTWSDLNLKIPFFCKSIEACCRARCRRKTALNSEKYKTLAQSIDNSTMLCPL